MKTLIASCVIHYPILVFAYNESMIWNYKYSKKKNN